MVACLDQWRHSIIGCDDAGLPDQIRDIESVSRMEYSVMLDAVAELENRNIAVTAGGALAPCLPNTAVALAADEIGPVQVKVITEMMGAIPTTVGPAEREAAEAELALHARSFHPTALHKIGQRILAHLDPDGPELGTSHNPPRSPEN